MLKVIEVENLKRVYKTYRNDGERLLEILSGGLYKRHGQFTALEQVSFSVKQEEAVGIIGRNGAGKSTLLKLLAGLLQPTAGTIEVSGRIAALLELGLGFHPDLTGIENIKINAAILGLTKKEIETKLPEIVDFAEIGDFINQPVKNYSTGMEARLAFAILTALDTDIFLIDEILAVGDAYFVDKCLNYIRSLALRGKTVIMVSHNIFLIQRLTTRTIWLDKGKIIMDGPSLEVCRSYEEFINSLEQEKLVSSRTEEGKKSFWIENVTLLNEKREASSFFRTGEGLTVRIAVNSEKPVDSPGLFLMITRKDGVLATSFYSPENDVDIGRLRGRLTIKALFRPLLLGDGYYYLTVGFFPKKTAKEQDFTIMKNLDLWDKKIEFKVARQGRPLQTIFDHPITLTLSRSKK